jgi:signal transduction histidine kinase/DNA-binding response OmpR family regulator
MQDNGTTNSKFISEPFRTSSSAGERPEDNLVAPLDTGLVLQLADGTIQACNAAAERILGATSQQIQDGTATRFPWRTIREDGSPFPREMHPAAIALQTGQACPKVVMGLYKPDGELIWLQVHAQPLFLTQVSPAQDSTDRAAPLPYATIVTFTDITAQKWQTEHPVKNGFLKSSTLTSDRTSSDLASEPLASSTHPRRIAQQQLDSKRHLESTSPQTVLCVDDNDTNLYITSRLLQEANFTVWQARTGSRALELANEQPDLIILDVKLPDISGTEVCQRLKANPATASIPVLHLSAERITSRDKVEGLDRGADGYLIQPINSEELLATARSLLRLRSAEQVLRRSQERLHRMVETAQIGIAFVQSDGEILEANEALLRMLGYTPEEVREQGLNWKALLPLDVGNDVKDNKLSPDLDNNLNNSNNRSLNNSDDTARQLVVSHQDEPIQQQLQQWGRFEPVEKELVRKDGKRVPVLISGTQLSGEVNEQVTFVVDLSDRKQIEAALQQRTDDLSHANHVKDEFLAVLSHELRSPLNPILGWCRLLQSRKFDPERTAEALATIERNAKLQTQLIDDLLDVSRILRGKLSLNVMSVDLVYIIKAAIETVRLAAEAKSIQFEKMFEPNVGLVTGDAARLQQVVWNLLSNAVKFTPAGNRIAISLSQQGTQAQIQVTDTGRGISADFLPYVFDYFRQADNSTTRRFGGLGLGLAIVRQIVELHGGTVRADSPGEGQGATFTVCLPTSTTPSTAIEQAPASAETLNLSNVRVMVVDDEPDSREFVAFVLEQAGAQVTALSSAVEVLQALPEVKPDVLVSDIGMPEVDGYTLIRQIRMLPPQQDNSAATSKEISCIPAIALTAYAGETNQQQALAAGFQWHLAKPVVPDELVAIVAELAQQSSSRNSL